MATVVLEESLKYKDGKKWKSRWGVLRRLSPVADRLHISFFKDINDHRKNNAEKASVPLEDFYGIDSGFTHDKEQHVIAIVCQKQVVVLAFQSRQSLIKWEVAIRSHLGEEKQFQAKLLNAPSQAKFPLGAAKLFVQGEKLCVTHNRPPRVLGSWQVNDLQKFGVLDNNFCFVAGPRCGKSAGTYAFMVDQAQQVETCLKQASQQQLSWRRASSRPNLKTGSSGQLTNAAAISASAYFEPPLPSPSYSTHTSNYADLSLVNEEDENVEDEEGEEGVVTFLSSTPHTQPAVKYTGYPPKVQLSAYQGDQDFQHILDEGHQYDTPSASAGKTVNLTKCSSSPDQEPCHTNSGQQACRRYSCGDIVDAGNGYANNPESVQDSKNSQDVMSNVQRNIDALSPKLNHCANVEQLKSATLPSSKKPMRCVVESHGQQNSSTSTSSAGSVDLSDAILKASGSLKSSCNSSNSSSRDLVENTPTVSCNIGKKSNNNSGSASRTTVLCNMCHCELVRADGRLSALCNCTESTVGNVYDRAAVCNANRVDQNGKDALRPSILRCHTAPVLPGAAGSNRPLEAVDFNRFDGNDNGEYLYWMKGCNQEISKVPVVYTNVPTGAVPSPKLDQRVSAASVAVKLLRDPQYVNVPSDSELEVKKSPKQKNKQWKNRLLSFHDSLRRPKSKNGSKPAVTDPLLAGSYVSLKGEKGGKGTGKIAKGKSLEDVLSTYKENTLDNARNDSQTSLYGTPSRSRRSGKRLPPPFEPAPAIPVRMNGNQSAQRDPVKPEPIYAVPVINSSSSRISENLFSFVRPYADHSLIACHRPVRRQTVCSSEFTQLRENKNNRGSEKDPVFCTVELPPKPPNQATNSSMRSMYTRGFSAQFNNSDPSHATSQGQVTESTSHDNATYLQMNLGSNTSSEQFSNLERSFSVQEGPHRQRPKLNHSRSLDNELDGEGSSYTDMNIGTGRDKTLPHASVVQDDNHSTYIPMSPGASGYSSHAQAPSRPFDNLIEHQHHSNKPPVIPKAPVSKQLEGKINAEEVTEKAAKPTGLFRFMRRNSSNKDLKEKEKKSKSNEETQSSIINTVHEDPAVEVMNSDAEELIMKNTNGSAMLHRDSDPDIHEHVPLASGYRSRNDSGNILDPVPRRLGPLPERQHSYSYLESNNMELDTSNMRETQGSGESYNSLLDLPPAPPPPLPNRPSAMQNQGIQQQNTAAADAPGAPLLPPRTYKDQDETYMEMNIGSNSLKNPRNVEIQRPKMPTPEPEVSGADASPRDKEITPPPALPQKTASTKRSSNLSFDKPGVASALECVPLLSQSDDVGSASLPANQLETAGPYNVPTSIQMVRQKKAPNLTVDVPASISATMAGRQYYNSEQFRPSVRDEENDEDIWVVRDLGAGDSRRGTFSSARGLGSVTGGSAIRGRIDSLDTSASTAGSSDTFLSALDEHSVSSAITTLRPRSGKEYQRMDRRKLAEVLDMSPSGDESMKTTPRSPITPSVASTVFSFDTTSMCSHGSFGYGFSSGDDSPKFQPPLTPRPFSRNEPHTYVNLTFHKSESPRFMDTPPASPRNISKIAEQAHPQLNYAEIDLSDSSDTTKKSRKPKREGAIEYAMIDMVATVAASKVGREHAKNREDSLRRKDNLSLRRSESDAREFARGGKERRSLISGGGSRRDRAALMRSASSTSSRDRKLSSSSYN